MSYDLLMLALIAGLVVTQVFTIVNPGLTAAIRAHVQEHVNMRLQNTPKAKRELLEYAVSTAYYAVEQFRKTEIFKRALAAADKLTEQDLLKQETLKRAKQILLVMGVDVPDDGLLMSVLDTLVERMIQQGNEEPRMVVSSPYSTGVMAADLEQTGSVDTSANVVTDEQRADIAKAVQRFEEETGQKVLVEIDG